MADLVTSERLKSVSERTLINNQTKTKKKKTFECDQSLAVGNTKPPTLCFDGCCVDGEVGVPGQVPRSDDVLAEAACQPRRAGGLQEKRLPGLDGKLGAAAVPQRKAVRTLERQNVGSVRGSSPRMRQDSYLA